ncbi:2822_t:CDS:2 [Gigaspora rosea]|nr:2822_t:CDS:2 [Gigaspora rosea]
MGMFSDFEDDGRNISSSTHFKFITFFIDTMPDFTIFNSFVFQSCSLAETNDVMLLCGPGLRPYRPRIILAYAWKLYLPVRLHA